VRVLFGRLHNGSRDNSVGVVARLQAGCPEYPGSIHDMS